MTDREAFLRAIRTNPADDTVRLAFADWLDERGEREQAEFIRVQVELEPVRDRLEDLRTRELIQREEGTRSSVEDSWFASGPDGEPWEYWEVGFRRGLPDWMRVGLDTLLARGEDLFATYPTVRELAVFDFQGEGAQLAECPALSNVDLLEVAFHTDLGDLQYLVNSPHIRRVDSFRFWIGWSENLAEAVASAATPEWPSRIGLVQLYGGLLAGSLATTLDERADALARRINESAGRELAHVVRPFERLFPLVGSPPDGGGPDDLRLGIDLHYGMYAGRLADGTQALVARTTADGSWVLATFDDEGRLSRTEAVHGPTAVSGSATAGQQFKADVTRWLTHDLPLTPAVVRVREFAHSRMFGVQLWPRAFTTSRAGAQNVEFSASEHELHAWLMNRDYALDTGGGHFYADWRGRVHTS